MTKHITFLVLTVILFMTACGEESSTAQSKDRPHEPWVFRSVLDKNARVVTLALDDNIWAAYFTEDCVLYKAWKGGVNFDGPVYTTHHGPQPTSIGDAYVVNEVTSPWSIKKGNSTEQVEAEYLGHRYVNGGEELMYALPGGIKVYESVEASETDAMQPVFERTFTTEGVPEGTVVVFDFNTSSIADPSNIKTDGELTIKGKKERKAGKKSTLDITGELVLNSNGTTMFNTVFLPDPTIINPLNMGLLAEVEDPSGLPAGAKLIAQSDCKTCHNKKVKTIGPAYVSVASKYKTTEDNIKMLVSKVVNGGSGVWGNQIMNAHPDLLETDIRTMIEYILSLDGDVDRGEGGSTGETVTLSPDENITEKELLPGALTRVYDIRKGVPTMPAPSTLKTAKYVGVMSNFGNINGGDFTKLKDDFALVAKGVLLIDSPGTYSFRTWSDDGSKLSIGSQQIIDNDGLHGTEYKEATVKLSVGAYPFVLEYFQGGGGKFLSMNWKRPGDDEWQVVPPEAIFHNEVPTAAESSKVLPMANLVKIPGDKNPLKAVHPSFDLYQARPADFEPMVGGIDFMSDGDMIVSTWDAAGSVFRVKNHTSEDPTAITYDLIAHGLAEPLGVKVVNDRIFVMQKQEITELVDVNGDEVIDEYRTLCDDWGVSSNFHEFGFGLAEKDGYLYAALATAIDPGGASTQPQIQDRGKAIKVNIETGDLEFLAHGFRTPNGVGIGYGGDVYIADNQGDWLPSSKIVRVKKGNWYGSRSVDYEGTAELEETPPVVWLPQDEIGNSPSTPLAINVGPYKNQMIHSEVTHGGVKRVFVEEVEGVTQGALFRFTQGIEAGVNRIAWGPDGSLYMGGIGNPGNWGHTGKLRYGLQRMKYNGSSTFEMLAVRAQSNGMELEFTEPIEACSGWNPSGYEVQQWYYEPTIEYGGPKLDNKKLNVRSATVSSDRTKVFLEIDGMKEGHVVYVRLADKFVSEQGHDLWTTETWYTLNKIPTGKAGKVNSSPCSAADNTLSDAEKAAGWELLFDGKQIDNFRNYKKEGLGSSWIVDDNAIHLDSKKKDEGGWQAADGGDIITKETYKDFELHLEWKIGQCGNSGVMFNVKEDDQYDYVWLTGPEMQVLDNTCHPDTRYVTHRAGDLYDMIESRYNTVNPAGNWNRARIKSKDGKVEFWLNGYKNVAFEMHTDEWRAMVANSKFKDMPDFGTMTEGHISLQDHGDKVWYKNIKIKKL